MISKVWADSFWVIAGKGDRPEKFVTRTWLRTIHPPYYAGHGVAFTVRKWSLRIGVCTPLYNDVNLDDEADVATYNTPMWELDNEAQEIFEWVSSEADQNHQESDELEVSEPPRELPV
jgi:hypothetical protein